MPAPSTCLVSGTLYGPDAAPVSGASVKAYVTTGFTDASGNYIPAGILGSTTTATDGTWSLAVVQTQALGHSVTFQFEYPLGTNQSRSVKYAAVIPTASTATFSSLVNISTGSAILAASPTTDALPEGVTNLYFTAPRASAAAPVQSVAGRTGAVTLTSTDVGLANVNNTSDASKPVSTAQAAADAAVQAFAIQRSNHTGTQLAATISDFSTAAAAAAPVTSVASRTGAVTLTKSDVGLSSVDNTADASKPVSTAQAAADAAVQAFAIQRANHTGTQLAATISDFNAAAAAAAPVTSVASRTGAVTLTKSDVGLSNVDNTSDANKPVSTAQQTALNLKVDASATIAINRGGTGQTTAQAAIDALLPAQTSNSGKFLTTNGTTSSWATAGGGASGSDVSKAITQTAHGFAVGDIIYYTGSAYAKAKANADATSEALGIVSVVTDANNFTFMSVGFISTLSGLTAGTTYYLSDATAGLLTATAPTAVGSISKPMLVASSATAGYVIQSRGVVIAPATTTGPRAEISYEISPGQDATNTCVTKWTTRTKFTGTAFTDTATTNGKVTIAEAGIYAITFGGAAPSGGRTIGIVVNGTSGSLNVRTLGYSAGVRAKAGSSVGLFDANCSWTGALAVGDYVWFQTDGNNSTNDNQDFFTITKVSP